MLYILRNGIIIEGQDSDGTNGYTASNCPEMEDGK